MLRPASSLPTAWADFNLVEPDGSLPVANEDITGFLPYLGEWMILRDEDGNTCEAKVVAIEEPIVTTRPAWATFRAADTISIVRVLAFHTASAYAQESLTLGGTTTGRVRRATFDKSGLAWMQ